MELANELHLVATKRLQPPLTPPLSSHPAIPRPPNPQDLAIALVVLEGDNYTRILPRDYISFLQHPEANNNIEIARNTNRQIVNWVKYSILRYDDLTMRRDTLQFFVHAAQVFLMC